jgi:xanthine dehydrogenase accessory factor
MDTLDQQVLNAARSWAEAGHRFALVTVARTWGSAPRPAGSWLVLREDGLVHGSVSGGCIEDDLIRRMRAGEFAGERPLRLAYGVSREEAQRFGLPCGGSLELVLEPAPEAALLADLQGRLGLGQLVRRRVDVGSGRVSIEDGRRGDACSWDGQCLTTLYGPRWRLLIIGAGQLSRCLASMAQLLDYQVTVCDPRLEYSSEWDVAGAPWLAGMPDDVVVDMAPDAHTAIVALTHDPKLDDLALLEALKSPAFYVGALGSHGNNAKRRQRLLDYFDLGESEVLRLHGPVGLAIGSKTPPEIAVSILAEMTAVKNGLGGAASLHLPAARAAASLASARAA